MKMPKSKRRRSEATRVDEQQSAPAPSSEASPAGVAPKSSRRKKRKRSSAAGEKQTAGGGRLPLAGLILAVSVDHKQGGEGTGDEAPSRGSYKFICDRCRALGAQITSQVHRRVHAVIASPEAVRNATQRVRKAIKKGVAVVDSGMGLRVPGRRRAGGVGGFRPEGRCEGGHHCQGKFQKGSGRGGDW